MHLDALTVALSDGSGFAALVYPEHFSPAAGWAPGTLRMSSRCLGPNGPNLIIPPGAGEFPRPQ